LKLALNEYGLLPTNNLTTDNEQRTILDQFTLAIKKSLEKLGLFIENGIAKMKEIVAEKLTAEIVVTKEIKTERVTTNEIQIVDKATGEIYCTWIENGEWKKVKGECEATNNGTASNQTTNSEQSGSEQQTTSNEAMVNFLNLPYSGKVGEEIKFEATTSNFATDTLIFNWYFGDETSTTTATPFTSHVYNATGTFTLILSVQEGDQSASVSTTVEIEE
jgi:phosphohistidine swiveling domain-containing protein